MNDSQEGDLYELLLRLDALEEVLEELEERSLETLDALQAALATEPGTEELREIVGELLRRGVRTTEDVQRELEMLERHIDEPGAPDTGWLGPN